MVAVTLIVSRSLGNNILKDLPETFICKDNF